MASRSEPLTGKKVARFARTDDRAGGQLLFDRHAIEMTMKGTDTMNTSKYPAETRKNFKRGQQSPAYRDLQQRALEERTKLETKLRERNEVIDRLKKKLVEKGVDADEVAKIAA